MLAGLQQNKRMLNVAFGLLSIGIIAVLAFAPEETTSALPRDEKHAVFFTIKSKKQAEKGCSSCHGDGQVAELSKEHPPKYRCLFCHKRQ